MTVDPSDNAALVGEALESLNGQSPNERRGIPESPAYLGSYRAGFIQGWCEARRKYPFHIPSGSRLLQAYRQLCEDEKAAQELFTRQTVLNFPGADRK